MQGASHHTHLNEKLSTASFICFLSYHVLISVIQMDSSLPPVQKLVVPAAAPVSGNRSVSFRPTLTPGGMSRPLDRTPRDTVRNTLLHYVTLFFLHYMQPNRVFYKLDGKMFFLFYSLSLHDNHHNYLKQPQVHLKGKTRQTCFSLDA